MGGTVAGKHLGTETPGWRGGAEQTGHKFIAGHDLWVKSTAFFYHSNGRSSAALLRRAVEIYQSFKVQSSFTTKAQQILDGIGTFSKHQSGSWLATSLQLLSLTEPSRHVAS